MDQATLFSGWMLALAALTAFVPGILIGTRLARRQRRALQRRLAQCELALLDVKSEHARLQLQTQAAKRREELLSQVTRKLGDAQARVRKIEGIVDAQERRHRANAERLETENERARAQARQAKALVLRTMDRVRRLEAASAGAQPIIAREPGARADAVERTEHGQSVSRTGLQAIDGITPALERRLNEAGIHRVEQLAELSDHEADALDRLLKNGSHTLDVDWQADARRALDRSVEHAGG